MWIINAVINIKPGKGKGGIKARQTWDV